MKLLRTKNTPSIVLSVDEFTERAIFHFLRGILSIAEDHSTRYHVEITDIYGEFYRGLLQDVRLLIDINSRCVFFSDSNQTEGYEGHISLSQVKSISLYEVI